MLANGRRWDDSPTVAADDTNTDASPLETETGLHLREFPVPVTPTSLTAVGAPSETTSAELTAAEIRVLESLPPPSAEPASNPEPTTSTRLDPGFVHLVSGTLVDVFEIEKLLGVGGMGAVYGAHHERLGRRAAIKVISPSLSRDRDAVERFEQEAQALAKISHPNIVGVLSVGTLPGDGRAYFVMEWLDGNSLQAELVRGGIGFSLALYVLDQIARGLEAAHAAEIVHRDLKPDNVWLQYVAGEPRPIVKILDFGLSKLAQHQRTEHTAANVMFGTTAYMSPEQCRSARDVGPATDLYALGCVAYELLCGRLPFAYDNTAELVAAHLSEAPPRPASLNPSIDPTLDTLLATLLAKDPTQRPSLAHVRYVIANAQASSPSTPRPLARAAQPKSPGPVAPIRQAPVVPVDESRAPRRVFVAFGGLVVLGVVIAAALARSGPASLDQPNVEPDSPPVPGHLLDGGAQEAGATIVAEPGPKPATVDTTTVDASVERDEAINEPVPGDAGVEVNVAVTPGGPSSHRTPPTPTTKRPPNRDGTPPVPATKTPPKRNVISDPFKKKEITK